MFPVLTSLFGLNHFYVKRWCRGELFRLSDWNSYPVMVLNAGVFSSSSSDGSSGSSLVTADGSLSPYLCACFYNYTLKLGNHWFLVVDWYWSYGNGVFLLWCCGSQPWYQIWVRVECLLSVILGLVRIILRGILFDLVKVVSYHVIRFTKCESDDH